VKYKTLIRLILKVIGLYLVVNVLVWLAGSAVSFLLEVISGGAMPSSWYLSSAASYCVQLFIGVYLFVDGRWVADRIVPSNRPYCHECAYDLTGLPPEGTCPECGTEYRGRRAP
jgi:uncharacterized paraquat-inducible protein A